MASPSASAAASAGAGPSGFRPDMQAASSVAQIPDALLERMMDRKLRMLDLEYEECLKATKSRNIEDYDQGPTGDDWDRMVSADPEASRARGYEPFGGAAIPGSEGDLRVPESLENDEWSESWAEYQRTCAEEEAEAKANGITPDDVAKQTTADSPPPPPKPLTPASISTIQSVMSAIKLRPPIWAHGLPDEVWQAQILARAGFRLPRSNADYATVEPLFVSASTAAEQDAAAAEKKRAKQKKKRAKKAASGVSSASSASASAASAPPPADDFEASFPTVTLAAPTTSG